MVRILSWGHRFNNLKKANIMKFKYLHYIIGALLACMLSACFKDLGNYDYEDPNKVVIGGINEYYAAMQGYYFESIPQLAFTDPAATDSARYKY